MLVMKDNYNKKIAPFAFDYVASKVIPVNVNISMAVMDVLSISEVDLVYVLKFRFLMVWYDYRLKYHNLKQKRSLNSLSREEIERLWIPFVVFSNTENQEATKGGDETEVTITREGQFTESPVHVIDEINIFKGVDNGITFQQVYSKTLKCVYQLQLYPFDTQVPLTSNERSCFTDVSQLCTVDMEIRALERETISLVPELVFMESDTVLVQYIISSWSLQYRSFGWSSIALIIFFSF